MGNAFIPGLKALRSTTLSRVRELPLLGRALVKIGDSVNAEDPVLAADLPGNLHILRISEKLGIDPEEVISSIEHAGISVGSVVEKGAIIAEHSGLFGLFKSRFESPCQGTVEYISKTNGHVGIREQSSPLTVKAYISGKIIALEQGKSVKIETSGALIQGIFGVGGEKVGQITLLDVENNQTVTEEDLPKDCSKKILVGGTNPSIAVLREAVRRGAVGFVVGAIDDQALTEYLGYDLGVAITGDEDVSMTLIISEGFGNLAISDRIISLLRTFNNKSASINGATQVRAGAVRPEIIIVHDQDLKEDMVESGDRPLELGSQIRVIRVPYFGAYGEVVELPSALTVIETGAEARVLKAKLDDGRIVTVPRANVEIVS